MKHAKLIIICLAFVVLAVASGLLFKSTKSSSTRLNQQEGSVAAEVRMTDDAFEPADITIKEGQAVRFMNVSHDKQHWPASNIHPTHDLYPEFDVKRGMAPGEQWVFTFRRKGTWPMHDHLYPYIKGTITVE